MRNVNHRINTCKEFITRIRPQSGSSGDQSPSQSTLSIVIGRSSECDIVLTDAHVSRIHGVIRYNDGEFYYTDKSTNGTLINGVKIHKKKLKVTPQDKLKLSESFVLDWNIVKEIVRIRLATSASLVNDKKIQPEPKAEQKPEAKAEPQGKTVNSQKKGCLSLLFFAFIIMLLVLMNL